MHDLISAIKELSLELKRTPTRLEFITKTKHSRRSVVKAFGSYSALIQAAGLDQNKTPKKAYDCLQTALNREKLPNQEYVFKNAKIFVIGDTHFPFNAPTEKLIDAIKIHKPSVVVQVGDLHDCFAQGRFPRSLNTYNPTEEIITAHRAASLMWAQIKVTVPGAKLFQLHGNHTSRPYKALIEKAPELEPFVDFTKFMSFDGVTTIHDPRQELIINDIVFMHGYRSKLGDHMKYNQRSTVCGHSHVGGVVFEQTKQGTLFELNAGYWGNPESKALGYTAQRLTRWTHGYGIIDEHGPRFISVQI